MFYSRKFFFVLIVLTTIDRSSMWNNDGSHLKEEIRCEEEPDCLCMRSSRYTANRTKLVCEKEINVDASSALYFPPVIYLTVIKVFCEPKIEANHLLKDYYRLLKLKDYGPEFNILNVVSCPELPMPYSTFLSPTKSPDQLDIELQIPQLNNLNIHCSEYRGKFFLQKKHLQGLQGLKRLEIYCQTMITLSNDLFNGTTPILSTLFIESTRVSFISPDSFSQLSNLRELHLRNNSIRSISDGTFDSLTSLDKLDLSRNSITDLGDDLFHNLGEATHLNLSHNNLISLPRSMGDMKKLQYLDISYNSLSDISQIEGLDKLVTLNAQLNKLTYINPQMLASLKSAQYIYLSGNEVLKLDPVPFPLNKLIRFSFSHNSHPALHLEPILSGDVIEELVFSNSSIVSIHPDILQNIPTIKIFDFSENKLSILPEGIFSRSKRLHYVNLRKNNISELHPNTFSNNLELERLDVSANRISSLHDAVLANNHVLRILDLSNNQLTALSHTLFQNKSDLTELYVANNRLTVIDPNLLSESRNVGTLDLSGNLLQEISDDIFFPLMERLFKLYLDRNCISSLPLLQLPDVKYLNLSHNCLEHIQEGLFQNLTSLDILDLSHNKIKYISASPLLPQNLRLTLLDLSNNHLTEIPCESLSIRGISIDTINFSSNALSHFYVDSIVQINYLVVLNISNNNLTFFGMDSNKGNWFNFSSNHGLDCLNNSIVNQKMFTSIQVLDLSYNNLDFKDAGWFYDAEKKIRGKKTFLRFFPKLQVLLLSKNAINTIFLDWRDDLHELRLLDLRHNKIFHLQHQDIIFTSLSAPHFSPRNKDSRIFHSRLNNINRPSVRSPPLIVDLRGNLIRGVDVPRNKLKKIFLNRNGTIPEGIYGHATILLDENPISCGCSILEFLRIVQNDLAPITDNEWTKPARIEVGNLSCWEPESIRGSLISEPETWIHHILPLISLCSL